MGYPAATYDLVLILVKNALKYTLDTKVNYDPDQLCHLATPYFSITVVHVHAGPDKREFIAVNVPRLAAGYICQSLDKDCSLLWKVAILRMSLWGMATRRQFSSCMHAE